MSLPVDDQGPLARFLSWYGEAEKSGVPQPDAMILATASRDGHVSARTVLFRGLSGEGIRFFTHYRSRKGQILEENPRAALCFYWAPLHRQVRIEGRVERLSAEESDAYFRARPREHQLNAWVSPQSEAIESLEALLQAKEELAARYEGREIPRPDFWGGYRLLPERFEFWVHGENRFHDRFLYQKVESGWEVTRLAP